MFQELPPAPEPHAPKGPYTDDSPAADPYRSEDRERNVLHVPAAPAQRDTAPPDAVAARLDGVSVTAFVISLLGAALVAIPLAIWGLVRTGRLGPRRGRGFAIAALCVSAAWSVASVVLLSNGLIRSPAETARTHSSQALPAPSVAVSPPTSPPTSAAPETPAAPQPSGPLIRPKRVYWEDLEPTMCVRFPQALAAYYVTVVDCRAEHDEEVIARTALSGPRVWPGDSAVDKAAEGKCRAAFEPYVGIGFDDSRLDLDFVTPEAAGWRAGNRTVICLILDPSDAQLARALRDSRE